MSFLDFFRVGNELTIKPRGHLVRRDGRAIVVIVSGDGTTPLELVFTKRIEAGDVVDGKLVPSSRNLVKRRGGKRVTTLVLSYEGAEDLCRALKPALKDMRRRRRTRAFVYHLVATVSNLGSRT